MAWVKTIPANNEKFIDTPALIRANWDAIELLTDSALQITNAKIAAGANILDTKLAQITTAGKVHGSALTGLASIPGGAGVIPIANIPGIAGSKLTDLNTIGAGAGSIPSANMSANALVLTGAQSAAGIKTFTSIPVLPSANPTTDYQAAHKYYVDNSAGNPRADIAAALAYKVWELEIPKGYYTESDFGAPQVANIFGGSFITSGQIVGDPEGVKLMGDGTNAVALYLSDGSGGTTYLTTSFPFTLVTGKKVYIRMVVEYVGASYVSCGMGLGNDGGSAPLDFTPTDGIWLRYGDTNFSFSNADDNSRTDTTIESSHTNERDYFVTLDPGVSIDYTIDGVAQSQLTTNIPDNGEIMTPFIWGPSTNGRGLFVKKFQVVQEL